MEISPKLFAACAASLLVSSMAFSAHANDRHFAYNYETAVLAPGERELEVWTTWRSGRDTYYSRLDHRLEFEVGLTESLMTAFYLNFHGITEETPEETLDSRFAYDGVSSEWKLKLSDPVADAIGSAAYLEASLGTNEYELEAKLLLDKRIGDLLLTLNLVGELEWEVEKDHTERALVLQPLFGAAYLFSPAFSAGLEARDKNVIEDGKLERSVLQVGPAFAFSAKTWWATATFLPQLLDLKTGAQNLTAGERYEARLLFSMHL